MVETPCLKNILEKIVDKKKSIIITLPSTTKWEEYEKENDKVVNYKQHLKFQVYKFPNGICKGDKCYIVYNGYVKGWMEIVGFSEKETDCSAFNKKFNCKYIERSGPFHYIDEVIPYKSFHGYRYFDIDEYKLENNIK